MPGFYKDDEYDVAGFIVGLVGKDKIIDGSKICKGDLLLGLPSTGLHTNGYSLARHIVFEKQKLRVDSTVSGFNRTIGEELLEPHRSYLKPVKELLKNDLIKGMAHITGGGFIDNIPRILPEGVMAQVEKAWPVPQIFNFLIEAGNINAIERYRVFNMGIGMVLIIDKNELTRVEKALRLFGEKFYLIGQIVDQKGKKRVKIN